MDLSNLSPDELQSLKTQLGLTDATGSPFGRSPILPRQLHNLTLKPTATDPRPTFFWSAEEPRNAVPEKPKFSQLMWHGQTGTEITVYSVKDRDEKQRQGYILTPPANAEAPDPADLARQALAQLSPEDRKTVLEAAQEARLARVKEMASALSADELDALRASLEPKVQKRSA
jgi:hypothetical protein